MKKNGTACFGAIVIFLCTFVITYGQKINTANGTLSFKSLHEARILPEDIAAADAPFSFFAIAAFDQLPDKQRKEELKENNIKLISWIDQSSYIIKISSKETYADLLNYDEQKRFPYLGITSLGIVPEGLKLSQSIDKKINALPDSSVLQNVIVSVYEKEYLQQLKKYLAEQSIILIENQISDNSISVSVSGVKVALIKNITGLNYVKTIELYNDAPPKELATPNLRNKINDQIYAINYDTANGYTGRNTYSGNIETISSTDPEILTKFRNRLVLSTINNTDLMDAHARATASVNAAGNNFDELIDRGIAPGTIGMSQAYWDASKVLANYNSGIHPLSVNSSLIVYPVGQANNSPYTTTTAAWDDAVRNVPDLMFAVSSGNNGADSGINGYPAGWNNISYNTSAKNTFAVSNINYPGKATTFGCNGPFNDGRLAPQICAEGNGGTSFASPAVAGLVSDLYEAYMKSYNTSVPRSDVVKAVIMNTAQDIYKKGPDFKTGYGEINPYEAVKAIQGKNIITDSVEQGSSAIPDVHTLNVGAGLRQLRVMLYWHDYEGATNAVKVLVNDLDLKVITPTGDTILPWVLHPSPSTVTNLATRGIDTLNNQEQVTIDDPQEGTYKFLVYGKEVPMGPQPYVITYMLNPYHIKITTPNGYRLTPGNYTSGESRALQTGELDFGFTWDYALNTTNAADSIQVFMQRQSGEPFTQIGSVGTRSLDDVSDSESAPVGFYLKYDVPADFPVTSTARIIVKQKNQSYADTSGYFQYTPMPQNLRVTSACPEQITLQWDKLDSLHSGGRYIIYRLGTYLMEPVDSVDDTRDSVTLDANTILGAGQSFASEEWFAIAARQPDGALSYRTYPVTQKITNPMSPQPVDTLYTLCKGDTAIIAVDPNFIKDSVRWYKNGDIVSNGTGDTLILTGEDFGKYTYKSYHNGCAFESDTFYINKSPDDIAFSDTVYTVKGTWRAYIYKGDYANNDVYGYFDMTKSDYAVYTTDYFTQASASPWTVAGYVGCPLTQKDFTMVMKRNGFPDGNYTVKEHKGFSYAQLWINDTLVYQSPQNLNAITTVWHGHLTMDSKIKIVLRSMDKSEAAFDFIGDTTDINLALNKSVVQMNTYSAARSAFYAVDGDYTTFSSTKENQSYPYMNIDLGSIARIDLINLWNRYNGTDKNRLQHYYIFVSNDSFENANTHPSVIAARSDVHSIYRADVAGLPTSMPCGFTGRYIRIQLDTSSGTLNVPELEAFGQWLSPDSVQLINLAFEKPAQQSTVYKGCVASRAVDGVVDGKYNNGSLAHTLDSSSTNIPVDLTNPWWMVDLGKVYKIRKINVYNRTDAVSYRLKGFNIIISKDSLPMTGTTTNYPGTTVLTDTGIAGSPTTFNVDDVEGRYIALQIPGTGKIISLAEMQVYGIALDSVEESLLPVKFGTLTAKAEKEDILLQWSTTMENNSNSFDIEKLDGSKQFKRIGSVMANGVPSDYEYKDLSPQYGVNTYRLKEYDKDGSFSYSAIASATFGDVQQKEGFSIQPNPVKGILKIIKPEAVSGKLLFQIINVAGRRVLSWNTNTSSSFIEKDVSFLKAGVYFLRIQTSGGNTQTLKFIKN